MRKLYILITIISIVLSSCISTKKKLHGNWIETNNYENPERIQFEDFYLKLYNYNINQDKIYHLSKDTLYVNGYDRIVKFKIVLTKNGFELCSLEKDSSKSIFERNNYTNLIDYFNKKKNTLIELPKMKADEIEYTSDCISLFADYQNGELCVFINGLKHNLNDTSFFNILYENENESNKWYLLYIDKNIKLTELNKIKIELQKAHKLNVAYIVQQENNELSCIGYKLMPYEGVYPADVFDKLPPMRSLVNYESDSFNKSNVLCRIGKNGIVLNSNSINLEELKKTLRSKILSNPKTIIHAYFDDSYTYEDYLSFLVEMKTIYHIIKEETVIELNKTIDDEIEKLNSEDVIYDKFPMRIREIDEETYLKLKKYAL